MILGGYLLRGKSEKYSLCFYYKAFLFNIFRKVQLSVLEMYIDT